MATAKKAKKVYIPDDSNEEALTALRRFLREAVVDEDHKKVLKKYAIINWSHGMWGLTIEARDHARKLGYL